MFASMLLSILLAGAPDAVGPLPCDDAHAWADFEQTHAELSLVGATPLYGLEDVGADNPAIRALSARESVPPDAAPLFGVQEPAARLLGSQTLPVSFEYPD